MGFLSNYWESAARVKEFKGENAAAERYLAESAASSSPEDFVEGLMLLPSLAASIYLGWLAYPYIGIPLAVIGGLVLWVLFNTYDQLGIVANIIGVCVLGFLCYLFYDSFIAHHRVKVKDPVVNSVHESPFFKQELYDLVEYCKAVYAAGPGFSSSWQKCDNYQRNVVHLSTGSTKGLSQISSVNFLEQHDYYEQNPTKREEMIEICEDKVLPVVGEMNDLMLERAREIDPEGGTF
jgi:hypothetical protein